MLKGRKEKKPVFIEKDEKPFRAVHAHFADKRKSLMLSENIEYPSNQSLEVRQAMLQAKTSYETMMDFQEKLHQAYYEILSDS